jgi:hypothetical protein
MFASRLWASVGAAILVLGFMGCGPTHYQPSGKLTKGGAPLKISEKAVLQIALYAESDASFANPESVKWDKDGTFTVTGRQGNGIPAGKYKVSVVLIDPYPGGKDVFGGKFEKGKAPVFDIKSSQTEIVIETAK